MPPPHAPRRRVPISYYFTEDLINNQYDENIIEYISEYCQGDIRHLIMILEDLYISSNGKKIEQELLENTTKFCGAKEQDIQLKDSTRILMTQKISIQTSQLYFDIDCLLTPLMIYHNSINYIKYDRLAKDNFCQNF
jgi:hypothetical protein